MAIQVLYGNEPYGIDVKRRKLVEGVDSLNIRTFSGDFTPDVLSFCQQFPFLAVRKVVLLNCESLKSLDTKAFSLYLDSPVKTTDLLVIVKNVDKRVKIYKKLHDKGVIKACDKVSMGDFQKTILYEAKKRGGKLSVDGLNAFSERINYENVEKMNLIKAVSYLQTCIELGKGEVTSSVVEKAIPFFQDGNAFSIAPCIMSGDISAYRNEISLLQADSAIGAASAILRELRIAYKSKYFSFGELSVRKPSVFNELSKDKLLAMISLVTNEIAGVKVGTVATDDLLSEVGNSLIKIVKA